MCQHDLIILPWKNHTRFFIIQGSLRDKKVRCKKSLYFLYFILVKARTHTTCLFSLSAILGRLNVWPKWRLCKIFQISCMSFLTVKYIIKNSTFIHQISLKYIILKFWVSAWSDNFTHISFFVILDLYVIVGMFCSKCCQHATSVGPLEPFLC